MIHIVHRKQGSSVPQKEVIRYKNHQTPFSLIQERHKNEMTPVNIDECFFYKLL
jgi:hypothetical protein